MSIIYAIIFPFYSIAIVGLAPEHPILLDKKNIVEIIWAGAQKQDESKPKISGKRKLGAPE